MDGWRPLSRSPIWAHQRTFYESRGPSAWAAASRDAVPQFITTNAFTARQYVDMAASLISADPGLPRLTVIELGSGSGQFGFLFVMTWINLCKRRHWPVDRLLYVMTDLAERNVAGYERQAQLSGLARLGVLDFAVLDAEQPPESPVYLRRAGHVWLPGPTVVIANYVFDSLPQEMYATSESMGTVLLMEIRLTSDGIVTRMTPCDPSGPAALLHGTIGRNYSALVPVGSLSAMRRLLDRIRPHEVLFIVADKGPAGAVVMLDDDPVIQCPELPLAIHGSCSLPVSFGVLTDFCRREAANIVWSSSCCYSRLRLGVFGWGFHQASPAVQSVAERLEPFDFFQLQAALCAEQAPQTLSNLLSILRLSHYDAHVFHKLVARILLAVSACPGSDVRSDTRQALLLVRDHCFVQDGADDVLFHVGRCFHALADYQEAIRTFDLSVRMYGPDPITLIHRAFSMLQSGNRLTARRDLQRLVRAVPHLLHAWTCLPLTDPLPAPP